MPCFIKIKFNPIIIAITSKSKPPVQPKPQYTSTQQYTITQQYTSTPVAETPKAYKPVVQPRTATPTMPARRNVPR